MKKKAEIRYIKPHFECGRIESIPLDLLIAQGITRLGFDWDGTLMGQKVSSLHPNFHSRLAELKHFLAEAKIRGIEEVVILSNVGLPLPWLIYRTHLARRHLKVHVIRVYIGQLKPKPIAFERMMAAFTYGATKENTAFIGDRIDTDILGAAEFGLTTVWITDSLHEGFRSRLKKKKIVPIAQRHFQEDSSESGT